MLWDTGTPSGYAFRYDSLNRIKSAKYAEGSGYNSNVNLFNTSYTYDKNGNFITHNRFLNGIRVDSLYYTYQSSGNRLQSVTDRSLNYQGYNAVSGNYAYDSNGNMTYDVSKGFTITYNQLNLPQQISCVNDYALYTWDAVGNKLAKKVYGNTAATTRYDYSGNFLYENSVLKCIFTSEGRIVPFNNNGSVLWNYEYNQKDHLGNTRVVFTAHSDGKPETNQITNYDPFGFVTQQSNWYATGAFKNKYLYNGKELQDDQLAGVKVDWYDYGARMYDPELGRWHSVDPMAEKSRRWSPYNYCIDNPMRFIDPDGMEVGKYYNESGQEIFDDKKNDQKIYVIKTTKTTEQLYDQSQKDPGNANPISVEAAASTEERIKSGDLTGNHMKNIAYVGTETQVNNMLDIVGDNGTRGELPINNREYGGKINKDGNVIGANPGPIMDPMIPQAANIEINAARGEKSFHSHPSGTKLDGKFIRGWGSRTQAPSGTDIKTSTSNSEYVFGMRSYTLFLYNSKGVYATMPLNLFTK
jgi:RHS repeat-associated protein